MQNSKSVKRIDLVASLRSAKVSLSLVVSTARYEVLEFLLTPPNYANMYTCLKLGRKWLEPKWVRKKKWWWCLLFFVQTDSHDWANRTYISRGTRISKGSRNFKGTHNSKLNGNVNTFGNGDPPFPNSEGTQSCKLNDMWATLEMATPFPKFQRHPHFRVIKKCTCLSMLERRVGIPKVPTFPFN